MEPIALALIVGFVALLLGATVGWRVCNLRWVDAAKTGNSVRVGRETYFALRDDARYEPTDMNHLSAE